MEKKEADFTISKSLTHIAIDLKGYHPMDCCEIIRLWGIYVTRCLFNYHRCNDFNVFSRMLFLGLTNHICKKGNNIFDKLSEYKYAISINTGASMLASGSFFTDKRQNILSNIQFDKHITSIDLLYTIFVFYQYCVFFAEEIEEFEYIEKYKNLLLISIDEAVQNRQFNMISSISLPLQVHDVCQQEL